MLHIRRRYQFDTVVLMKELKVGIPEADCDHKRKTELETPYRNFAQEGQLRPNREMVCAEGHHQAAN